MKKLYTILLCLIVTEIICGQNFLINGGFEDTNICSEYKAPCAPEAWFRIPPTDVNVNTKKSNAIYKGNTSELVVVENNKKPIDYRVFLYTMLIKPLEKDTIYQFTLYINPLHHTNFELGVKLTDHEIVSGELNPIDYNADFKITPQHSIKESKTGDWQKMSLTYTAKGGERFITLGNFDNEPLKQIEDIKPNNTFGDIIYLLDEISITPIHQNYSSNLDTIGLKNQLYQQNHRHTNRTRLSKDQIITLTTLDQPKSSLYPKTFQVDTIPPKMVFEIPDLAFDFDKSTIKSEYFDRLDSILQIINSVQPRRIGIIGHTDNIGEIEYNEILSLNRAQSVQHYMKSRLRKKYATFTVLGKGELEPIADNNTSLGRSRNRRVVISIQ